jgi:hypothetical protein
LSSEANRTIHEEMPLKRLVFAFALPILLFLPTNAQDRSGSTPSPWTEIATTGTSQKTVIYIDKSRTQKTLRGVMTWVKSEFNPPRQFPAPKGQGTITVGFIVQKREYTRDTVYNYRLMLHGVGGELLLDQKDTGTPFEFAPGSGEASTAEYVLALVAPKGKKSK